MRPREVLLSLLGLIACIACNASPALPPPPSTKPVPPAYTILRNETLSGSLGEQRTFVVSTPGGRATDDRALGRILEDIHESRGRRGITTVVWFRDPQHGTAFVGSVPWPVEISFAFAYAMKIPGASTVQIERGTFN